MTGGRRAAGGPPADHGLGNTGQRLSARPIMVRGWDRLRGWVHLMAAPVAGRRPDRPVPPMAGAAVIGAVGRRPATAVEEGRNLSSKSGMPADISYRPRPA
ncbi:hypothetical protein [Streptomyces sp. LN704]|uniref:hypothetical protein n=1 Tax=unclassified Streptomyces TaxID=2593676 RepID=UPI00371297B3